MKYSLLFYCHRRQVGSYEELHIKNSGQKKVEGGRGFKMNANLTEMWIKEGLHYIQTISRKYQ